MWYGKRETFNDLQTINGDRAALIGFSSRNFIARFFTLRPHSTDVFKILLIPPPSIDD